MEMVRTKNNQLWLVVYFVVDLVLPYLILVYSATQGLIFGWIGGVTMFFMILVMAVYGYMLSLSFPTAPVLMWKQLRGQLYALITVLVGFIGAWSTGAQQWSVQVVSALLCGLGLALLVTALTFEKAVLTRCVAILFGFPLVIAGVGWLWILRPEILPLAILSWLFWAGAWYQQVRQKFLIVYQFFSDYYLSARSL